RYVGEALRRAALAAEQVTQDPGTAGGLRTARGVERHVVAALQPLLEIPIGEPVPNIIDGRSRHAPPLRPQPVGGAETARCAHTRTAVGSAPHRVPAYPERSPSSFLADDDIGRVRMFHSDDVVAGIDVMNLARHPARKIAEKIDRGIADLLDR